MIKFCELFLYFPVRLAASNHKKLITWHVGADNENPDQARVKRRVNRFGTLEKNRKHWVKSQYGDSKRYRIIRTRVIGGSPKRTINESEPVNLNPGENVAICSYQVRRHLFPSISEVN